MNDQDIREAGDVGCIRSDINVLKIMVSQYEEQGGRHSQKEALNTAIKFLSSLATIKGSGMLPGKKEPDLFTGVSYPNTKLDLANPVEKQRLANNAVSCEAYNEAIDKIALKLAKFLSGLKIGLKLVLCRNCKRFQRTEDMDDCPVNCKNAVDDEVKAITDHIKSKMGVSDEDTN